MQPPQDPARHRAHMPEGSSGILNARSLVTAHRRLAELLQPGMTVLDVGCATGAITQGIADHLSEMFTQAGLVDIVQTPQHEVTTRADPDFATRIAIWAEVAAVRGPQMVESGIISKSQRATAEADYRAWIRDSAESQTMYLLAVEGVRS